MNRVATPALVACVCLGLLLLGCKEKAAKAPAEPGPTAAVGTKKPAEPAEPALKAARGVDVQKKVIRIGALNDESGRAAAIGRPYAVGKRVLAARINAGGSGLLPEGWKVELVERDHGYNPQKAVQGYNDIGEGVLFLATSFGTPNTLPLRPWLTRDKLVAFPASLSSKMAEHDYTPPLGPPYSIEAMRAVDWAVEQAGGAEKVKAGVVYQQDDYGKDGLEGWTKAAAKLGVKVVSEQAVAPGQKDVTAVVAALKDAGATHVLLVTLPSGTGPILGTAAQLQYKPIWIGNTPSWIDRFFDPKVIPAAVLGNFYWMNGLPYWGEEVPGMEAFTKAWTAHGAKLGAPDFYVLVSYVQGLTQIEAARRAIESGDITPKGFVKALKSLKSWTAGGMIQPLDLSRVPYVTSTKTRVLKPDFEKKSWTVASGYAEPQAVARAPAAPAKVPAPPAKAPAAP
jgi:ABC-type branched-subunit amino acid transport system substrate-binding protein